jgi:hypothetical protein
MAIANVQLGVTETTICQSGASETRALLSMLFCNTDSVSHTVTVYAYPTGGSAGATSTVLSELLIPAKETFTWEANNKLILAPSDKVSGICDLASKVSVLSNYMVL